MHGNALNVHSVTTRGSFITSPAILPTRAVIGLVPNLNQSILPPCLLGKQADSVCLTPTNTRVIKPILISTPPPITIDIPQEINKVVQQAIGNYLTYHHNPNLYTQYARGSRGFFTSIRHGKEGIYNARKLMHAVLNNDPNDTNMLVNILDEFFTDKKRRFHRHSLSSYLLDGLY